MDATIAKHILRSENIGELKNVSTLIPAGADAREASELEKKFGSELLKSTQALCVKMGSDQDLRLGKDRLLTAMEESAKLVGMGEEGQILRASDFHGATGQGQLSSQTVRDLVNPERPHMLGSMFALDSTPSGDFMPKGSKTQIGPKGLIAMTPARIADKLVSKIESVAGFEGVWAALSKCSSNEKRLGGLGGVDCYSQSEMRTQLEASFSSRLEAFPVGPASLGFPKDLDSINFGDKISARRESVAAPARDSSPPKLA